MRCTEKWKIGFFGSNFFFGNVIGSTLLAEYGDTIGRIPLIRVGQMVTVLSYSTIVFWTRDTLSIYALFFVIGLFSSWRLSLGFIYGSEIIAEAHQNIAGSLFNLFDAQVVIFSSIFLQYVSTDWVTLHSVYIGLATLAFFISFLLPESPKFLVQRKQFEKACDSYNLIAKING